MSPSPAQPHLNGAYYGPSIPKSSNRPGRGSGPSCNPLTCCFTCICSCLFNLIYQILTTILITLIIITIIFYFIFRPNVPKIHVHAASITQFNLSPTNNTLYYNIITNMTFRNPNRRLGIYYDVINASTRYHDARFSNVDMSGFYLGHKSEKDVGVVFKGQQVLGNDGELMTKFDDEKSNGVFEIDLKLKMKIRFKVLWMKTPRFKPRFDCDLKVPVSLNNNNNNKGNVSEVKFERTKCDFDW